MVTRAVGAAWRFVAIEPSRPLIVPAAARNEPRAGRFNYAEACTRYNCHRFRHVILLLAAPSRLMRAAPQPAATAPNIEHDQRKVFHTDFSMNFRISAATSAAWVSRAK